MPVAAEQFDILDPVKPTVEQTSSTPADANKPPTTNPSLDGTLPPISDPWRDDASKQGNDDEKELRRELRTPDPSTFDQAITASILDNSQEPQSESKTSPTPPPPPVLPKDVLTEFDPLAANPEEIAAREAWQSAESHPPPPPSKSPSSPVPSPSDKEEEEDDDEHAMSSLSPSAIHTPAQLPVSPTPSSAFPSLAALARTFSIPAFSSRGRPQSLEVAKPVPSPSTLSSFATQQQEPPPRSQSEEDKVSSERPLTPVGLRRSGTSSPATAVSGGGPSASASLPPNGSRPSENQFDFQRFLDQMKSRGAEPVSKYLRSCAFLSNFAKRSLTVSDQIKVINDFLSFISGQMRNCDIWKNATDQEFDNAMEGMEKLVMNRLYEFTFTPQVALAVPPRPITTDDLERDRVLSQRIALFGWLEEKHLDIPVAEGSSGFLTFAQQELLKINHYKAPRDKLICILNCCKVIFGLLRHLKREEGADSFLPILIFVVIKANPEHLLSNVEFINRFRNPGKLQSEAGYYLSSLMGAVSFIETMDHTSLSCITQEEFEKNVEEAIQNLPPSEPDSPELPKIQPTIRSPLGLKISPHAGEESAQPLSIHTPVQALSEDAKRLLQKTGDTISKPLNAISRIFSEALDGAENKLSYLPGPFGPFELGREQRAEQAGQHAFGPWAQNDPVQYQQRSVPSPQTPYSTNVDGEYVHTPYKPRVKRMASPSVQVSPGSPAYGGPEDTPSRSSSGPYTNQPLVLGPSQSLPQTYPRSAPYIPNQNQIPTQYQNQALLPHRVQSLVANEGAGGWEGGGGGRISRTPTPSLDFTGVQAEIDMAHAHASAASRETLRQMFPAMDVEVLDWVLEAKEGDLGKSIETLLEMSSGS